MDLNRRKFIKHVGQYTALAGLAAALPLGSALGRPQKLFFDISLAQWSLNKSLFGGKLTNMEFPEKAKKDYGIDAVEYVNQFFMDKAKDTAYLKELKQRTDDLGVTNVLIMIDREGHLANLDANERMKAVENHYKWVEAAKMLGCHSIRVNAAGQGCYEDVMEAAVDGLSKLTEFARQHDIGVIVENHGGFSSDANWLTMVMDKVNMPGCGTLPDFGNFRVRPNLFYDRYAGVEQMMPFAKGVSAKSHEFDASGNETMTDYKRMLKIVKDAGYKGYIGIEYEGRNLNEDEGIMATKRLLERVGNEIS